MLTARRQVEVQWGDCDPAGIVFNPRFFEWFDAATANLFKSVGLAKRAMRQRFGIVGIPLVETRARFLLPSHWGEVVVIESSITAVRRSSFDVHHRLIRPDGAVGVEGEEARVWAGPHPDDPTRLKAVPMPEEVMALLRGAGA